MSDIEELPKNVEEDEPIEKKKADSAKKPRSEKQMAAFKIAQEKRAVNVKEKKDAKVIEKAIIKQKKKLVVEKEESSSSEEEIIYVKKPSKKTKGGVKKKTIIMESSSSEDEESDEDISIPEPVKNRKSFSSQQNKKSKSILSTNPFF